MPGIITLEGGVPVVVENQIVGAIGISGMQSAQDGVIAAAAVEVFGS
jgi:glc operon protein GlcG